MPTRLYDSKGNAHVLTEKIGRGGEGTVYYCAGNDDLVAKIYHEPITDEKATKLRWMAENQHERLTKIAAWVVETLHEKPHGKIIGFLMPRVKAKEIHELYSLKSRRVHFPDANWNFLIHTATNVARAFYSLQKYDHVMGDVNHGNCVVLADGTVQLIDCDSYAIKTDEGCYPCKVGVGTHLAPELQKADLSKAERLPKHDNFGLAVIIFQLLFLGRHPFSGNYLGEKDKTLEDCIREYRFAYGKKAKHRKVKQPPGTLFLKEVSPKVAELFEKAFDANTKRPTPKEWIEALSDLSKNLEQCVFHPGHHFYKELATCPWCRIEARTGLVLFPFSIKGKDGSKAFNIYTIENLIAEIDKSSKLPAKLPNAELTLSPKPEPQYIEKREKIKKREPIVFVVYALAIFIFTILTGYEYIQALFPLGALVYFLISDTKKDAPISKLFSQDDLPSREELVKKVSQLLEELDALKKKWGTLSSSPEAKVELNAVKRKIKEYKQLQRRRLKDLKLLRSDNHRRQFNKYLRSSKLADADIWELNDLEKDVLIEKGITTAAQVEEKRLLYYYNLDKEITEKLLKWRKEVDRKFEYNSKAEITKADKERFFKETAEKRISIEREINKLMSSVHTGSAHLKKKQEEFSQKSKALAEEIAQTKANMKVLSLSNNEWATLLAISFVFPVLGIGIHEYVSYDPFSKVEKDSSAVYNTQNETNYKNIEPVYSEPSSTESDLEPAVDKKIDVPDSDITDEEIAKFSEEERKQISNSLISSAEQSYQNRKYPIAEDELRLALRYEKNNMVAFADLGRVLYERQKYAESIKYLEKARKLGYFEKYTRNYIGMNQLQLKRYKAARQTFLQITKQNGSNASYFNLGLANKGLKDYKKAAKAFEKALEYYAKDVSSHYELGLAYYKLNDKESFNNQYSKLLTLDEQQARQLLENTYKYLDTTPKAAASS